MWLGAAGGRRGRFRAACLNLIFGVIVRNRSMGTCSARTATVVSRSAAQSSSRTEADTATDSKSEHMNQPGLSARVSTHRQTIY
jgi:hypothetical protein